MEAGSPAAAPGRGAQREHSRPGRAAERRTERDHQVDVPGEAVARQCRRDDHAAQTVSDEVDRAGEHVLHGLDEPVGELVHR